MTPTTLSNEPTPAAGRGADPLRVLRFLISGGVATLSYLAFVFLGYRLLPSNPVLASFLAYTCSIGVSFALQRYFTFRSNGAVAFELPRFVVSSLIGLALSTVIVAGALAFDLHPAWGFVLVAVVVAPTSYLLMAHFVFKHAGRAA